MKKKSNQSNTIDMQFEKLNEASIIKVIGVGGGGSNAVNHMFRQGIKGVEFIVCNTDAQALESSPVPTKIQLGPSLTEGRGAGSIPKVGRNAAIENIDDIKLQLLENTKMVFITAGMGGGTGTGAAPVIAQVAKEMGILTVGIVTEPFAFEGKKRREQADAGIEDLKKNVDTLLVICNDKLRMMYGNLKLGAAFSNADDVLATAARGIAEIITVTGYINVDFEDVKTVMTDSGVAIMGSATASGENRALVAVESAMASPLLNDNNIQGARYILMNIASGTDEVSMDEIGNITDFIQEEAGLTADIIWGNCYDENLGDKISVTIIATGFKTKAELGMEERAKKTIYSLDKDKSDKTVVSNAPAFVDQRKAEAPAAIMLKKTELSEEKAETIETPENHTENTEAVQNDERTFEFEVSQKLTLENPVSETEEEIVNEAPEKTIHALETSEEELLKQELFRKTRERVSKLKAMNYRLNQNASIADLENEPAYKRKNVVVDTEPHSGETRNSHLTISTDPNSKGDITPNDNSYLHTELD
jgi:cell division protein FtsZ